MTRFDDIEYSASFDYLLKNFHNSVLSNSIYAILKNEGFKPSRFLHFTIMTQNRIKSTLTEAELPLLQKRDGEWHPKPLVPDSTPVKPKVPTNSTLVKPKVPTKEAEVRFLGRQPKDDVLTRYGRRHRWNPDLLYKYEEPGCGQWLFCFAGNGKDSKGHRTKLWDIYLVKQKSIDNIA